MPTLTYLFGPPGVGKSTAMAALTAGWPLPTPVAVAGSPVRYLQYTPAIIQLGAWRPGFPGTDTLSMSVQPALLAFLAHARFAVILGEGDRLANTGFFTAMQHLGYTLQLYYFQAPAAILAARRQARGSHQQAAWVTGRTTKAQRLATTWAAYCTVIDATQSPPIIATQIRTAVCLNAVF